MEVLPLTLSAAIAEALERHPALHALRAEYEAARAMPAQEGFLSPPMLETQIWAWPITTLNPTRADMYMFMAEQELPGRGKRAARTLVAEREADRSRQQVAVRAVDVLDEVRHAFVDLALAREVRTLYDGQEQVLQDMADAATLRYASGAGPQHHTVASLVDLARLERERIAADEHVQSAESRLNTALGRPVSQPVGPLAPVVTSVSPAQAEALALARHPEFGIVDATVAREEAELARLQGERRPDFIVAGGYMLMPGEAGALTVRAGLSWPNAPWSRGRLTAQITAQGKRVEAARAQREVVASRVRQAVREVVIRHAAAERQLQLMESTVLPQVEHAFELARVAYTSGEGAFMDMLESRRLLLTTQIELAEGRAQVNRALADLETTAGVL